MKYNKKLTALFVVIFISIGTFIIFRSLASVPQGTYTDWSWQASANGFNSMEHTLTIEAVNTEAPYFWSHLFKYIAPGDGGYIGLQSNGGRVDGSRGKTAVFSIFSTPLKGTEGKCLTKQTDFDGYSGSGTSCRVAFDWQLGRSYRLKVSRVGSDLAGTWWAGYIDGVELARIQVPLSWAGIKGWSQSFTEFFGAQPSSCSAIPYSRVRFGQPLANGSIAPSSAYNHLATGADCFNSKVAASGADQIHEVGIPPLPAPPNTKDCKANGTCPRCNIAVTQNGSAWTAKWTSSNLGTAKYGWGATLKSSATGTVAITGLPINGSRSVAPVVGVNNTYTLNIYDGWAISDVSCSATIRPAGATPPPPPPPPPAAYCRISVSKSGSTWIASWNSYNLGTAQYGWDATLSNSATGNTTNNVGVNGSRTLSPRVGYDNTYTLKIYDGWAVTSTQCSTTIRG